MTFGSTEAGWPSATREFFSEVPNVSWDDVGGLEKSKTHGLN